jgi:tRNA A-37 threonylcarbamoyl transferase component Bud32
MTMTAIVLADVVHGTWVGEFAELDVANGKLERMAYGTRVGLLRALVQRHRGLDRPVLVGVQDWFEAIDGRGGALQRSVEARNRLHHGAVPLAPSEERVAAATALAELAEILERATFLRKIQLLHLDGAFRLERGRLCARLRRLAGLSPYVELPVEITWSPRELHIEPGHVYLVDASGQQWLLIPFLRLQEGVPGSGGDPRPSVLSAVDRRGQLTFEEPSSGQDSHGSGLPGPDWRPVGWKEFVARRSEIAPAWRQYVPEPHPHLVWASPDLSDGLEPEALIENFRLVELLGEGGSAVVWKVEDRDDGQAYALKVLKSNVAADGVEVRRFEDEVRSMKRLYADGCDRVVGPVVSYRVGVADEERVVLRMPLMHGTLKDRAAELRAVGGLTDAHVRTWAEEALEALVQLHERGVVHRDVKPSNFLLDVRDEVRIADLGVARDARGLHDRTRTGDVLGTDRYMAPEQRVGAKDVSPKADVYALAVSLDELATGDLPVVPGRGMSGILGDVVRAMGRRDPDERPSASEALAWLRTGDAATRSAGAIVGSTPAKGITPSPPVLEVAPSQPVPAAAATTSPRQQGWRWGALAGLVVVPVFVVWTTVAPSEPGSDVAGVPPNVSDPLAGQAEAAWVVTYAAFSSSASADAYIAAKARLGHSGLHRLWIPDWPTLSGKPMFLVYGGPYALGDREAVLAAVVRAREVSDNAYAAKLAKSGAPERLEP